MKKLAILAALMMGSLSAMAAVAVVNLNNFDAVGNGSGNGVPIFFQTAGTLAPTGANINVQIMGGASGSSMAAITDASGNPITIAMGAGNSGAGYFDAGAGIVPGLAASASGSFQLVAWQGASLSGATLVGKSAVWTQTTGSWDPNASPPTPIGAGSVALQIPGTSVLIGPAIPEPSTLALGLLGGLALLIRRRK